MKNNVNQIWEMINSLTPEEKKSIYKKMQDDVNQRLNNILDNVNERAENQPIDIESITKEVETVRGKHYEQG